MNIAGAALMAIGPILAVILVVAVPVVLGMMIYDVVADRRTRSAVAAGALPSDWSDKARLRIQWERGAARAFVILGGVFWGLAAFAGYYAYQQTGVQAAFLAASVPLMLALATLLVGWKWERAASVLLVLASAGVVYWGIANQFELGVWTLVTIALIGPMMTAAVLFWLARQEHRALEFKLAQLGEPAYAESETY
jgi:hypothetical protein